MAFFDFGSSSKKELKATNKKIKKRTKGRSVLAKIKADNANKKQHKADEKEKRAAFLSLPSKSTKQPNTGIKITQAKRSKQISPRATRFGWTKKR